jgi:hypothetical protein
VGSQCEQAGIADIAIIQKVITGDKHDHYNMPIVTPMNEYTSILIKVCPYCSSNFSSTHIISRTLSVLSMFSILALIILVD